MEPIHSQEQSHSRNWRACTRGSFTVAHNVGRSKPIATTPAVSSLAASTQRVETQPESTIIWQQMPPPGFVEIAKSLWGGWFTMCNCRSPTRTNRMTGPFGRDHHGHNGLHMTMPGCGVRHCLPWHGNHLHEPCGFGAIPLVVDCPMPTLEGWEDSEFD